MKSGSSTRAEPKLSQLPQLKKGVWAPVFLQEHEFRGGLGSNFEIAIVAETRLIVDLLQKSAKFNHSVEKESEHIASSPLCLVALPTEGGQLLGCVAGYLAEYMGPQVKF